MKIVAKLFSEELKGRVLDIGGSWYNWSLLQDDVNVVSVNIRHQNPSQRPENFKIVTADGMRLPFDDKSFDLVFCNSVIEHLGSYENQQKLAREIERVGSAYFVQTPNRWFFLEPHYFTPLVHFFPKRARMHLLRNFTLWGWITRPSESQVQQMLEEIRLLTSDEMRKLFPEADHRVEHFLGLKKSLLAVARRMENQR